MKINWDEVAHWTLHTIAVVAIGLAMLAHSAAEDVIVIQTAEVAKLEVTIKKRELLIRVQNYFIAEYCRPIRRGQPAMYDLI